MVGGIHTVLSSKARTIREKMEDRYILVGPDLWRGTDENPEFREDRNLYADWRAKAAEEGLRVRTGRWKIPGEPIAFILDFTIFMEQKDKIFSGLWESFRLDSMSGQWDYIEPALFGFGAGKLIESFAKYHLSTRTRVVAQFHEWMTGGGLLYLAQEAPQIATVFTTHATVIGRSIAANRLPLYDRLAEYDGDDKSNNFNVVSKQSLEKLSAMHADAFTTVSDLTARECSQLLKKEVDCVTPDGFDISIVPPEESMAELRERSRRQLIRIAESLCGYDLPEGIRLVATSGRYEFHNKGQDLFLDALSHCNEDKQGCPLLAYMLIPAHHYGARKDLLNALEGDARLEGNVSILTHNLHNEEYDPIIRKTAELGLRNAREDRVKVVFVPSYLNGNDGLFNRTYYELLAGFDLTVFASYYEPWGYTPLESLAFGVPAVTTTLAGFGLWVREHGMEGKGIRVIERTDANYDRAAEGIAGAVNGVCAMDPGEFRAAREHAAKVAGTALWENQVKHYYKAFDIALSKVQHRTNLYFNKESREAPGERITGNRPEWRTFIVQENIPEGFSPLDELSRNLWWSWNSEAEGLFRSIDPELWSECQGNPVLMLRKIPLDRFRELEKDRGFRHLMSRVLEEFHAYMEEAKKKKKPKIAYFSMEYGLHDSLKIFSGGLGILAGDYLKEASDQNRDVVGVGLLYRYGYFTQMISGSGEQIAANDAQDFSKTAVRPVREPGGNWKTVKIMIPGRTLTARIWRVDVGRVPLYLLDTDFEENIEQDRSITHQLYGGDNTNRFVQELLLGIGGIRMLDQLDVEADMFHCNEGHAAMIGIERLRELITCDNLSFEVALEVVRSTTLYTTHTPVAAGHDSFDENLVRMYLSHYPERFNITWNQFIGLGRSQPENREERFSMSYLAINLSQEVNGVSRVHGRVTQEMFADLWKGYNPDELFISYVTNGVHFPTWTAGPWQELYTEMLGGNFRDHQSDRKAWRKIMEVDPEKIWAIRNSQREHLVETIRERLRLAAIRKMENPRYTMEAAENLSPDVLTIGFARRFATYKRAHLLFRDKQRLEEIINHPQRPVQFIFAGKAHPHDKAGQDLIRMIVGISREPAFAGRIIFLQNYDISLARKLVQGVDVWLNTPTRPLEASGTSGQKAVLNGALHFSVLDGWWAEGYTEGAGWALEEERTYENQDFQDELDAEAIYSLLENEVAPAFYDRDKEGLPEQWIGFIRKSVSEVAPRFTMSRMVIDYAEKYYKTLFERSGKIRQDDFALARELVAWKKYMLKAWQGIEVISTGHPDITRKPVVLGGSYETKMELDLHGIDPAHVGVELVIRGFESNDNGNATYTQELQPVEKDGSRVTYKTEVSPVRAGSFDYGIRIFARHPHLPHRQDFPLMRWV